MILNKDIQTYNEGALNRGPLQIPMMSVLPDPGALDLCMLRCPEISDGFCMV